jgi:hypothetical protein
MFHPIYRKPPNSDLLGQGDILDPEPLRPTLKGHQDYIADQSHFLGYMVLTQTCDLDRTNEMADFIFLAVVRRLNDVFGMRHIEGKGKNRTYELLRALYNHNYNKRGLFYLPENEDYGIKEESVADLRVMFSIHKASYPDLLLARCGAITDVYAAQLGHIAGHMFNRIATPSWDELSPNVRIGAHAAEIQKGIEEREQRFFSNLKPKERVCYLNCDAPIKTYRWLPVRMENDRQVFEPHVLCEEHAKLYEVIRSGRPRETI